MQRSVSAGLYAVSFSGVSFCLPPVPLVSPFAICDAYTGEAVGMQLSNDTKLLRENGWSQYTGTSYKITEFRILHGSVCRLATIDLCWPAYLICPCVCQHALTACPNTCQHPCPRTCTLACPHACLDVCPPAYLHNTRMPANMPACLCGCTPACKSTPMPAHMSAHFGALMSTRLAALNCLPHLPV